MYFKIFISWFDSTGEVYLTHRIQNIQCCEGLNYLPQVYVLTQTATDSLVTVNFETSKVTPVGDAKGYNMMVSPSAIANAPDCTYYYDLITPK
tara:strand:+ start:754 stop:1032 length:279 start_codon:yes stop_codon:yes gene_type:complete